MNQQQDWIDQALVNIAAWVGVGDSAASSCTGLGRLGTRPGRLSRRSCSLCFPLRFFFSSFFHPIDGKGQVFSPARKILRCRPNRLPFSYFSDLGSRSSRPSMAYRRCMAFVGIGRLGLGCAKNMYSRSGNACSLATSVGLLCPA